jgi:hypothetical protein
MSFSQPYETNPDAVRVVPTRHIHEPEMQGTYLHLYITYLVINYLVINYHVTFVSRLFQFPGTLLIIMVQIASSP